MLIIAHEFPGTRDCVEADRRTIYGETEVGVCARFGGIFECEPWSASAEDDEISFDTCVVGSMPRVQLDH